MDLLIYGSFRWTAWPANQANFDHRYPSTFSWRYFESGFPTMNSFHLTIS
jgi:hypothetical protein